MRTISIVPRHVLGAGQVPPSETFGGALILTGVGLIVLPNLAQP